METSFVGSARHRGNMSRRRLVVGSSSRLRAEFRVHQLWRREVWEEGSGNQSKLTPSGKLIQILTVLLAFCSALAVFSTHLNLGTLIVSYSAARLT